MELDDCAFPLLSKVVATDDYKTAFDGCEIALLIGARPRGPGMTRADLLKANANIFKEQGKALNDYASRNVKVLVVGNPANTNAKIAMEHAPNLPKTAFSAMTRLDEIRATAQVAKKAGVSVAEVQNVIVWGNHSDTQVSARSTEEGGGAGSGRCMSGRAAMTFAQSILLNSARLLYFSICVRFLLLLTLASAVAPLRMS